MISYYILLFEGPYGNLNCILLNSRLVSQFVLLVLDGGIDLFKVQLGVWNLDHFRFVWDDDNDWLLCFLGDRGSWGSFDILSVYPLLYKILDLVQICAIPWVLSRIAL